MTHVLTHDLTAGSARCQPPARSLPDTQISVLAAGGIEDEMLGKLVNQCIKLYDDLQEEKRQIEDAKLAEAIRTNRIRLRDQIKGLRRQVATDFCKVRYSPPVPCLPAAGLPVHSLPLLNVASTTASVSSSSSCSSSSYSSSTLSDSASSHSSCQFGKKQSKVPKARTLVCRPVVDNELPPVDQLPTAAIYIYTPRNVLVEDQRALPNIPYFDDVTASEENPFIKEVISCYGNRIHCEAHVQEDEMLVQLVDRLFQTPGATSCKVFQALSCAFPDEGTKEDVKKRYDRLKTLKGQTTFSPNIDGTTAVSCSRERSLHSFKTLFCRRCLMYDCLLHSVEMDLPQEQAVRAAIRNREDFVEYTPREEDSGPCSASCYMRRMDYGIGPQCIDMPAPAQNVLRCEWSSSPGNFCFLAQVVNRKDVSCTMIYYWCKEEFPNFDIVVSEDRKVGSQPIVNGTGILTVRIDVDDQDENCSNPDLSVAGAANNIVRIKRKKTGQKGWTKKKNKYTAWQIKAAMAQGKVAPGTVHNYAPCLDHTDCSLGSCHCITKGHFCEKYCLCSNQCPYKFPGCTCNGTCNTKQCPCFAASRECDPDLCKVCGSGDLPETKKCANVDLQRMHKKHLLVAPSDLGPDAGWGCYLKERCEKNDLISEYVGEQISQAEADRRGLIYDRKKHSFLFCLNSDFSIDATRYGNKIRFANHSVNPNCFAKIMKVNGEHRIGIYAKRDIEKDEELFFDYKYGPNERIEFVPIESQVPASLSRAANPFRHNRFKDL